MLRLFFAPVRFTVFVLIGAFVLSLTNCVAPEKYHMENPPSQVGKSY